MFLPTCNVIGWQSLKVVAGVFPADASSTQLTATKWLQSFAPKNIVIICAITALLPFELATSAALLLLLRPIVPWPTPPRAEQLSTGQPAGSSWEDLSAKHASWLTNQQPRRHQQSRVWHSETHRLVWMWWIVWVTSRQVEIHLWLLNGLPHLHSLTVTGAAISARNLKNIDSRLQSSSSLS